jgi:hypothetical protein
MNEFVVNSVAGQKSIVFPTGMSYTMGTKSIFLFVDGEMLAPTKYEEVTASQITLKDPLQYNQEVCVKWVKYIDEGSNTGVTGKEIVVSTSEPDQKTSGLIWFNPDWNGSMFIWNSLLNKFEEMAFKRDVIEAGVPNNISGGAF